MGFFGNQPRVQKKLVSLDIIRRLECKACPLNKISNHNPHLLPSGAKKPIVYILGDMPGAAEDKNGKDHFIGDSGLLVRRRIPDEWLDKVRWNYIVRTRPPMEKGHQRVPAEIEIEACRPSIERDIAASKPKAIFGFGGAALDWAIGNHSHRVDNWRGRRFPVSIGGHECWFYVMGHPDYILKQRRREGRPTSIGSEQERMFAFDIQRALDEVESLPPAEIHTPEVASYGIEIVWGDKPGDLERLTKMLEWAGQQSHAGVDYETNCIRPYKKDSKILTAAVGTHEYSFAFALDHRQAKWSPDQKKQIRKLWKRFLQSNCIKISHFLNFEMEWTAYHLDKSLLRDGYWEDTATQASVIDERTGQKKKAGPLSLEFLIIQHFGLNLKALNTLDKAKLNAEKVEDVLHYNAMDAKYHYNLFFAQRAIIKKMKLTKQYAHCLRRVATCVLTQMRGVPTNPAMTQKLFDQFSAEEADAMEIINGLAVVKKYNADNKKKPFAPSKPDNVITIFEDYLKIKDLASFDKHANKKVYKTDEETLNKIDHPIAPAIIQFRKASKKLSTYIYDDVYPDGLLHPNFNTLWVDTKRLSCDDPNLQNVPKRNEKAKVVRKQIKAPKGHVVCAIDYGQIQARGIAMTSRDKAFCKSLWERYDVHGAWAERIARAYPQRIGGKQYFTDKKVMKDFRNDIKNQWTFPLFFGAQLPGVSEYLKIPENILEKEFAEFQREFSGVFEWHERLMKFYHANGYVEDLFGLRRNGPLSKNQVINSPIQLLEGVMVMDGMNRLSELGDREDDFYFQPNIQIHDDLTFIWPEEKVDYYAERAITEMLKIEFDFVNVPITCEMSVGPDLYNMKEVFTASSDTWKVKAA